MDDRVDELAQSIVEFWAPRRNIAVTTMVSAIAFRISERAEAAGKLEAKLRDTYPEFLVSVRAGDAGQWKVQKMRKFK